jgi:hypothetical protein
MNWWILRALLNTHGEGNGGAAGGGAAGEGGNGGAGNAGGEGGSKEGGEGQGAKPDHVSRSDHDRAVRDMLKYKDEAKKARDDLKKIEEERLKQANDWKTLAENAGKERDQEREARTQSESLFKNTLKSSRIAELAVKAGLRPEARDDLDHLELEGVVVESTDTGRYLIRGAEAAVENLKKLKPHWFTTPKAPTVNSGGGRPAGSDGDFTSKDVWEAEKKYGTNSKQHQEAWSKWEKGGFK